MNFASSSGLFCVEHAMKLQATLDPGLERRVASPSTAASRSFVVYMAYAASFVLRVRADFVRSPRLSAYRVLFVLM